MRSTKTQNYTPKEERKSEYERVREKYAHASGFCMGVNTCSRACTKVSIVLALCLGWSWAVNDITFPLSYPFGEGPQKKRHFFHTRLPRFWRHTLLRILSTTKSGTCVFVCVLFGISDGCWDGRMRDRSRYYQMMRAVGGLTLSVTFTDDTLGLDLGFAFGDNLGNALGDAFGDDLGVFSSDPSFLTFSDKQI